MSTMVCLFIFPDYYFGSSLYARKEIEGSEEGHRKVVAQEIHDMATLKSVYKDGRDKNATLRVLYAHTLARLLLP